MATKSNLLLNAKLAYLLSSCHKFTDSFMTMMTKQFEEGHTLATRHYFNLVIKLKEPTNGKYNNKFAIDQVEYEFAGTNDIVIGTALQAFNTQKLSWEISELCSNLNNQGISLTYNQLISLLTIAAVVKYYKYHKYKYSFFPITLDYGRGKMLHQTALIIDYKGRFIYYEPYGKYMKYDKSYAECVCDLFGAFATLQLFETNEFESLTYHKFLNLSDGIQNIIRTKNNALSKYFEESYKNITEEIGKLMPQYNVNNKKTIDATDLTIKVIDLLSFMNYISDNAANLSSDDFTKFMELMNKSIELYHNYNSKTCVTITLIEMNEFFKASIQNDTGISETIKNLYGEFDIEKPNSVLMGKLNALLTVFHNHAEISEIINENYNTDTMCNRFFK